MPELITLKTKRLFLRPLEPSDAPAMQRLVGDRRIAATTLRIPHPYEQGMAEAWIAESGRRWAAGEECAFGVIETATRAFIGSVGLTLMPAHRRAELGYWIGPPWWGQGFASEAVRAVVEYGFKTLNLNRIQAHCFDGNAASARVLRKIGMKHEGRLRQHDLKWDRFLDVDIFGLLREDFDTP